MYTVLKGKKLASKIHKDLAKEVEVLLNHGYRAPNLAVVIVGDNPASQTYVRNKIKTCEKIGMISSEYRLDKDSTQEELEKIIDFLNNDEEIDGILVQLPLPKHINESEIIFRISKEKDVDGFHPYNVGKLLLGQKTILPCTPKGIMRILKEYNIELKGKKAIVIGRSNIVGKPVAHLLLKENATITIAHSKTKDLDKLTREYDIIIAAVGRAKFVKKEWIKQGAVVIDVGINLLDDKLVGDVDFEEVAPLCSYITPVPKGVGPMTIAMLMENTLEMYKEKLIEVDKV